MKKESHAWMARPFSFMDRVALVWFALDAFTHLSIEAMYCSVTAVYKGAVNAPTSGIGAIMAMPWLEYGKADYRWKVYDPTVLSLELLTVLGMGPLALAMFYAVWNRKPWRHVAQVRVCQLEAYFCG